LQDRIGALRQRLTPQHICGTLYDENGLRTTEKQPLTYYLTSHPAVTPSLKLRKGRPCSVLSFRGGLRTVKLAGEVVAKRCESLGEVTYYEVKEMVRKIFKFELTFHPDKNHNYPQFQQKFRKRCEEVKKAWSPKIVIQ
jgi:hypothetical protein